jgi:hypothetical protein
MSNGWRHGAITSQPGNATLEERSASPAPGRGRRATPRGPDPRWNAPPIGIEGERKPFIPAGLDGTALIGRKNALEFPIRFEVEWDRLVRIIAENMDLGFRRVATLGFANLPGVTRY